MVHERAQQKATLGPVRDLSADLDKPWSESRARCERIASLEKARAVADLDYCSFTPSNPVSPTSNEFGYLAFPAARPSSAYWRARASAQLALRQEPRRDQAAAHRNQDEDRRCP